MSNPHSRREVLELHGVWGEVDPLQCQGSRIGLAPQGHRGLASVRIVEGKAEFGIGGEL